MSFADVLSGIYLKKKNKNINLVSFLNERLGSLEKIEPRGENHVFRVSEAIGLCPREEFLRYKLGVPRVVKIDPGLKMTFDLGKAFHSLVQNEWLGKMGVLIGDWKCNNCGSMVKDRTRPEKCFVCSKEDFNFYEVQVVNKEYGISGHPDGILLMEGQKSILELKTFNGKYYSYVLINKSPMPKHVIQAQMYMWLTGLDSSTILYFNKEDSSMLSFYIKYSKSIVDGVLSNVSLFRDSIRTDKLPERKICETQTCSRAKKCSVRKECFSR
jgi:hypothetical protein